MMNCNQKYRIERNIAEVESFLVVQRISDEGSKDFVLQVYFSSACDFVFVHLCFNL